MIEINNDNITKWSEIGERGTIGVAVADVAKDDANIVVIAADMAKALKDFSALYPDKIFDSGIAEQNMMGVAAGLALYGKIVFAFNFASFITMRSCEQVRDDVAYQNLNVKIIGSQSGYAHGSLGTTHHCIEDMGIFRTMPNMKIISPADGVELIKATREAASIEGPVYIRITGRTNHPIVYSEDFDFHIGKAIQLKNGNDITLIGTGSMVYQALKAAEILEEKGISSRVIDMHTIKPLDEDVVMKAAEETKLVVTVEEHNIIGGLGTAVAEVIAEKGLETKLIRMGINDEYVHFASYHTLLERGGLTSGSIADKAISCVGQL